ncbi:hypothetical protein GF373_15805, partial [bacterium]|nr:hypothetical protein [bacterium]
LLRGVIDLVFEEEDGWVIVDYKTDAAAKKQADALLQKYRPQIETYRKEWEALTGGQVKEMGLYFTSIQEYKLVLSEEA